MLRQLLQALQHTSNTTLLDGGGDVIEGGGEDTEEEELTYIPYSQRPETYIVPVIFGIIFLVGVIGNSCLIYILLRHKSMRSVPNTFIFNLAVGDLLVLLCSVPFTSTVYTFEYWPYGEFICKASEFAKDTSVGVSVFTLIVLSLDRYAAIVRPVQAFTGGPKSKRMIIILTLIWLTALILALPAALFSHLLMHKIPDKNGTIVVNGTSFKEIPICYPFPVEFGPNYPKVVVAGRASIHYGFPLLIIGTFYIIMARHLLKSTENIPGQATVNESGSSSRRNDNKGEQQAALQPAQNRNRRKVAKMVLSFVALFAVCFLPMHIFFLWFYFDPNVWANYNHTWHVVKIIGFCLAYTNSCINPIALYCVSTSFRKYFNRILFCCRRESNEHGIDASIPLSHYNSQQHRRTASSMHPAGGRGLNAQSSVMMTSVSTRRHPRQSEESVDTVTSNQLAHQETAAECHPLKSLGEDEPV